MNINAHVSLASAERSKQWFDEPARGCPRRFQAGGRIGTLECTLRDFARRIGDPHDAAPRHQWCCYEADLLDGAGKVSAEWKFDTPRGLVEVSDYWWNAENELSVRANDKRAFIWFRRWAKERGFECYWGTQPREAAA